MKSPPSYSPRLVRHRDVRRAQKSGRLRLSDQPLARLGVGVHLGREKLQRDAPAEALVLGEIHLAHSAAAESFEDVIVKDGGPDEPCAVATFMRPLPATGVYARTRSRALGVSIPFSQCHVGYAHSRASSRALELDRHRDRHHHWRRHLSHARRDRGSRPRTDVDARRLGHRRAGGAVRRARVRRARGLDA